MNEKNNKKNDLWIYVLIAIFIVIGSIFIGYVLEKTAVKGRVDFYKAFIKSGDYIRTNTIPQMFISLFTGNGITRKFSFYGLLGGAVLVLYRMSMPEKRYQKKGIEHGSARWGNKKERDMIADTTKNGFYNNVICSADVYLVLDRDVRENNEQKQSDGNKIAQQRKKQEKKYEKSVIKKEYKEQRAEGKNLSIQQVRKKMAESEKIKPMLNLNTVILGGSGTGKSRFFVKPNLLQCNTSFVVTDPSGELLQSCGKMLERMGYKIKVFNLDKMQYSSTYNPFHYLKNYDGTINNLNVTKMIDVFMQNTSDPSKPGGDKFWDDTTRMLLSAICFLLVETGDEEEQNFSQVLDLVGKAKVIEGKEEQKSELDLIFDKHKEQCPNAMSVKFYNDFKQAAAKTMQSILISTTSRLQVFHQPAVKNLTMSDSIHLEELGDEKQALFIIIPSTTAVFNFLAAMMYTQLFDTLYGRAINKYHGKLPVDVRFMLDEFANIGKIPDFEKVLATCRKFKISVQIILQNLSQLQDMYKDSWKQIPGNCDTMIYLGGNDQVTTEYIIKTLGKETIDTLSVNVTKSKQGSTSYNNGIMGRDLATNDELFVMDNNDCIVMVRGIHPFYCAKFEVKNHPRFYMLDEADKENNTYYVSEEIEDNTQDEKEIVDLSGLFLSEKADKAATVEVEVKAVIGEKTEEVPGGEEQSEILDLFNDFEGIYAA